MGEEVFDFFQPLKGSDFWSKTPGSSGAATKIHPKNSVETTEQAVKSRQKLHLL